jgi:regulator of sirC expression with transglutaminase-like and TPR domain
LESYLEQLDRIADRARIIASSNPATTDLVMALNTVLFDELRFKGNSVNYYDPRNSYLNEVLDRRLGIPITLSVVYMEVAKRIGITIQGVGLPGHFIVKLVSGAEELFIDPFNGGNVVGEAGCADLVETTTGGRTRLLPQHLMPVNNRQILTRMLSNILSIYSQSNDHQRSLSALERILILTPDSAPHIRDRGMLLAALQKPTAAIEELTRYLNLAPEAQDSKTVRQQISSIKQDQAKLN